MKKLRNCFAIILIILIFVASCWKIFNFISLGGNDEDEIIVADNEIAIVQDCDPNVPRNAMTNLQILNGVESGVIGITIKWGNTDLTNSDRFQYKVGNEGWRTSEKNVKGLEIRENTTIYARFFDGTNVVGNEREYVISQIDNEKPSAFDFKIEETAFSESTNILTLSAVVEDPESITDNSGAENLKYEYRVSTDDGKTYSEWSSNNQIEHNIENSETTYYVMMRVVDKAGNERIANNIRKYAKRNDSILGYLSSNIIDQSGTKSSTGKNYEKTIVNEAWSESDTRNRTVKYEFDVLYINESTISTYGTYDEASKTYTLKGTGYDPATDTCESDKINVGTATNHKMAVLKCDENLVIDSGVTVSASTVNNNGWQTYLKGLCVYVKGTLTNNGTISQTKRGTCDTAGENVYLWKNSEDDENLFEYVPAVGASGGVGPVINKRTFSVGAPGNSGENRGTGGGASGEVTRTCGTGHDHKVTAGHGAKGTSYSGGPGGGAASVCGTAASAEALTDASDIGGNGGYGRRNYSSGSNAYCAGAGGGTGNPGGTVQNDTETKSSNNGTGGLLIVYANNVQNGSEFSARGTEGYRPSKTVTKVSGKDLSNDSFYSYDIMYSAAGGSSGGGSINIFYSTACSAGQTDTKGGSVTHPLSGEKVSAGAGSVADPTQIDLSPMKYTIDEAIPVEQTYRLEVEKYGLNGLPVEDAIVKLNINNTNYELKTNANGNANLCNLTNTGTAVTVNLSEGLTEDTLKNNIIKYTAQKRSNVYLLSNASVTEGNASVEIDNDNNIVRILLYEAYFDFEFQAINQITKQGIAGIQYLVEGKTQDLTVVGPSVLTTDSEGKLHINNIKTFGKIKFTITQQAVFPGYVSNPDQNLCVKHGVTTLEINNPETSKSLKVQKDDTTRTLKAQLEYEPQKYYLNFANVDKTDKDIKLQGIRLKTTNGTAVYDCSGVTDENGNLRLTPTILGKGTYNYTITEISTPRGYIQMPNKTLAITVDATGNITGVKLNGTAISSFTKDSVNLTLEHEKDVSLNIYNLEVQAVDKISGEELNGIGMFLKLESQSGECITKTGTTATTDIGKGLIEIKNQTGEGDIKLYLQQTNSISGYRKDPDKKTILFNIDSNNNISYGDYTDVTLSQDPETHTLKVVVPIDRKEEENVLRIKTVDNANVNKTIVNVNYEIICPDGSVINQSASTESGNLDLEDITMPKGTYTYQVKVTNTEELKDMYEITEDTLKVKVTFDNNGNIANVYDSTGIAQDEKYLEEETDDVIKRVAQVSVGAKSVKSDNSLKIVKLDREDNSIRINNVKYQIKVSNGICTTIETQQTSNVSGQDGIILTGINLTDDNEITFKELESNGTLGYVIDPEEKTIKVYKDIDGNLVVDSLENVEVENNKVIKVIQTNTRQKPTYINIYLKKNSISNLNFLLGGTRMLIEERNTGFSKEFVTDINGEMKMQDEFLVPDLPVERNGQPVEANYFFTITELEPIQGYKLTSTKIEIEVRYYKDPIEQVMVSDIIEHLRNNKTVNVSHVVNDRNDPKWAYSYFSDIYFSNFQNEPEQTDDDYEIRVKKIDADKEFIIKDAEFSGLATLNKQSDGTNKGTVQMPILYDANLEAYTSFGTVNLKGKSEIEITETKVPSGYKGLSSTAIIELDKQAGVDLTTADVGYMRGIKNVEFKTEAGKRIIEITIENRKEYDIEIIKYDPIHKDDITNENLLLAGAKFKISGEDNIAGTAINPVEVTTKYNGKVITGIKYQDGDNKTLTIKETKAPSGYKICQEIDENINSIDIYSDEDGNIFAKSDNQAIDVTVNETRGVIEIKIPNKRVYRTKLLKYDADSQKIITLSNGTQEKEFEFVGNAEFNFEVKDTNGTEIYNEKGITTNRIGEILTQKFETEEALIITMQETKAAPGYIIDKNKYTIVTRREKPDTLNYLVLDNVTKEDEAGVVTDITGDVSQTSIYSMSSSIPTACPLGIIIDNKTGLIKIEFANKRNVYKVEITKKSDKVDPDGTSKPVVGAKYKLEIENKVAGTNERNKVSKLIKDNYTYQDDITTNSDGLAISSKHQLAGKQIILNITETHSPRGYEINKHVGKIVLEEDRETSKLSLIEGLCTNGSLLLDKDDLFESVTLDEDNKTIKVQLRDRPQYKVAIHKIDQVDFDMFAQNDWQNYVPGSVAGLSGAKLSVVAKSETINNTKYTFDETNSNGYVELDQTLSLDGENIKLTFNEFKAPNGYGLDKRSKPIYLKSNSNYDLFMQDDKNILSGNSNTPENYHVDIDNDKNIVHVTIGNSLGYFVEVNKIDVYTGAKLADAKFNIKGQIPADANNRGIRIWDTTTRDTDVNGIAQSRTAFLMDKNQEEVIYIQEKNSPKYYLQDGETTKERAIVLSVDENGIPQVAEKTTDPGFEIIETSKDFIDVDNNVVSIKETRNNGPKINIDNENRYIEIIVENEPVYNVEITKKSTLKNKGADVFLQGAEFKITSNLNDKNGDPYVGNDSGITDKSGKLVCKEYEMYGETEIIIQETAAPKKYINDELALAPRTLIVQKSEITGIVDIDWNDPRNASIKADEYYEVNMNQSTKTIEVTVKDRPAYNIKITDKNIENHAVIKGAEFNVTLESDNKFTLGNGKTVTKKAKNGQLALRRTPTTNKMSPDYSLGTGAIETIVTPSGTLETNAKGRIVTDRYYDLNGHLKLTIEEVNPAKGYNTYITRTVEFDVNPATQEITNIVCLPTPQYKYNEEIQAYINQDTNTIEVILKSEPKYQVLVKHLNTAEDEYESWDWTNPHFVWDSRNGLNETVYDVEIVDSDNNNYDLNDVKTKNMTLKSLSTGRLASDKNPTSGVIRQNNNDEYINMHDKIIKIKLKEKDIIQGFLPSNNVYTVILKQNNLTGKVIPYGIKVQKPDGTTYDIARSNLKWPELSIPGSLNYSNEYTSSSEQGWNLGSSNTATKVNSRIAVYVTAGNQIRISVADRAHDVITGIEGHIKDKKTNQIITATKYIRYSGRTYIRWARYFSLGWSITGHDELRQSFFDRRLIRWYPYYANEEDVDGIIKQAYQIMIGNRINGENYNRIEDFFVSQNENPFSSDKNYRGPAAITYKGDKYSMLLGSGGAGIAKYHVEYDRYGQIKNVVVVDTQKLGEKYDINGNVVDNNVICVTIYDENANRINKVTQNINGRIVTTYEGVYQKFEYGKNIASQEKIQKYDKKGNQVQAIEANNLKVLNRTTITNTESTKNGKNTTYVNTGVSDASNEVVKGYYKSDERFIARNKIDFDTRDDKYFLVQLAKVDSYSGYGVNGAKFNFKLTSDDDATDICYYNQETKGNLKVYNARKGIWEYVKIGNKYVNSGMLNYTEVSGLGEIVNGLAFTGEGKMKLEITEVKAAKHYLKLPKPITITFDRTFNQNNEYEITNIDYDNKDYVTVSKKILSEQLVSGEIINVEALQLEVKNIPEAEIILQKYSQLDKEFSSPIIGAQYTIIERDKKGKVTNIYKDLVTGIDTIFKKDIEGTFTYEITETKEPTGYAKSDVTTKIQITYEKKVTDGQKHTVISSYKIIKDGKILSVGSQDETHIILRLIDKRVDPVPVIEIQKIDADLDEQGNEIKLSGAKFNINVIENSQDDQDFVRVLYRGVTNKTGKNGITKISCDIPDSVTVELKEIEAPKGYKLNSIRKYVTITKNSNGQYELDREHTSISLRDKVTIVGNVNKIRIKVEDEKDLTLKLKKQDSNTKKGVKGALYEVKDVETGKSYKILTKVDGIAEMKLPEKAPGEYYFLIKELVSPKGYLKNTSTMKIKVNYQNSQVVVVNSNNIVNSTIENQVPDPNVPNNSEVFEDSVKTFEYEDEGIDYNDIKIKDKVTIKNVKLEEKGAGYVSHNSTARLINVVVEDEYLDPGLWTLIIEKEDAFDYEMKIPDTELKVTLQGTASSNINSASVIGNGKTSITSTSLGNGIGKLECVATTMSDGRIYIPNIGIYGDIDVDIDELRPAQNRYSNGKVKKGKIVNLRLCDYLNSQILKADSIGVAKGEIENIGHAIDYRNRIITLTIENYIDGYNFVVTKEDSDNQVNGVPKRLSNTKFKIDVYDETGTKQKEITATTDERGRIEIIGEDIPQKASYCTYIITEIETPKGYQKLKEPIKVRLIFDKESEDKNLFVIKDAKIISGKDEAYISSLKTGYVNVSIKDNQYKDEEFYKIEIFKKELGDRLKLLEGAKFNIKIKASTGEECYFEGVSSDNTGKIIIEALQGYGRIEVEIQETEAPEGYLLNSDLKTITYRRSRLTGKITVIDNDGLEINTIDDSKNVQIIINNLKDWVDPDPDPPVPDPDPEPTPPIPDPNPDPNPDPEPEPPIDPPVDPNKTKRVIRRYFRRNRKNLKYYKNEDLPFDILEEDFLEKEIVEETVEEFEKIEETEDSFIGIVEDNSGPSKGMPFKTKLSVGVMATLSIIFLIVYFCKNLYVYVLEDGEYKLVKKLRISKKRRDLDLTDIFEEDVDLNNVKLVMKRRVQKKLSGEKMNIKIDKLEFAREIFETEKEYIVVKNRTNKGKRSRNKELDKETSKQKRK